jgi:hypothetical protein
VPLSKGISLPATTPWPEGKRFAFTVFDDTDLETVANVGGVYAFLADCGFRTTKSCWVVDGDPQKGSSPGQTCQDPQYRQWLLDLQRRGFEIAWHNSTWHGLPRNEVLAALAKFAAIFGHAPCTAANHSDDEESMYWGDSRLSPFHAFLYNLMTRRRNHGRFQGHVEGNPFFWGDACKEQIKYFRNFVYRDINTLKACPWMPYHDSKRPYVNFWFASSDGHNCRTMNRCLSERNQDRLEEEGGACIMYTHFVKGFMEGRSVEPRFEALMRRLARKNGWFVPAATLLDYLLKLRGRHELSSAERRRMERKWLLEKLRAGST